MMTAVQSPSGCQHRRTDGRRWLRHLSVSLPYFVRLATPRPRRRRTMPTKIEWADETLSPIRARLGDKVGWACEKVSRGCENCYAQAINRRRGTRLPYTVGAMAQVEPYLDEAVLRRVLHWRKPRRIFWESMSDFFGWWV